MSATNTVALAIGKMMSWGVLGPAIAIGMIGAAALFAIARNPQAASKIQITMLIAIAFAEAVAIYVLIVALILKFTS